jgi:hypothetical protein
VDEGNDRGVFNAPDSAMLEIVDRHADEFGEEEEVEVFRCHHRVPRLVCRLAFV